MNMQNDFNLIKTNRWDMGNLNSNSSLNWARMISIHVNLVKGKQSEKQAKKEGTNRN